MSIITKNLVAAGILTALIAGNAAMAADVPAGVQLAEKTLVRNNGAEVQSLDPHKIEGVPESNVNRDLFEGLLVTDVEGHRRRVSPKSGKTKILKSGPSICAKMLNGPTVHRLPPKISFTAGSAGESNTASPYASYLQYGHIANIDDIIAGKTGHRSGCKSD